MLGIKGKSVIYPRRAGWTNQTSFKKGQNAWNEGIPNTWQKEKPRTEETKRKISEAVSGEKNGNYKGGITSENRKVKNSIEYSLWREAVFARDNWTCQKTGVKGGLLHPHHILNFAEYPELRFAIDNGVTFAEKTHKEFHKIYGNKHNNKGQLEDFLKGGK